MADAVHITSADDPRIAVFRDVRDRDLRGREGLFMAESELVLRRLLRTPRRLHALLLAPAKHAQLEGLLAPLPPEVSVFTAEVELMTTIAGFHVHRGVLAAGYRPAAAELSLDASLGRLREAPRERLTLLVAEGVTNVDNMGALFRNAAAFGAGGIVLDPTCCDPLYRKAIRVSMGHVLSVPWAIAARWPDDLRRLREEWGVTLVAAETAAQARPLWTLPEAQRLGLVFGAEAQGLSAGALGQCDHVLSIPMAAAVPSINVGTASAVFLYEVARRQSGFRA